MKNDLQSRSKRISSVDLPFLAAVLLLLAIGLATLYSAGYAKALQKTGNSYFYIARQGMFAAGGLVVMFLASWFPYKAYRKLAPLLYGVSVALLGAVLLLSNDSEKRWLYIG
ncbi:MAG: FtsW/RodA/SpoVE family cell cycle protein, partial [Clostridia bacterium]|nr:FtsW/RodA/SpoVE family cell cycle protein [Clostridia bacterium]